MSGRVFTVLREDMTCCGVKIVFRTIRFHLNDDFCYVHAFRSVKGIAEAYVPIIL